MKTHISSKQSEKTPIQEKAKNQADKGSILQAYRNGTAQLAADEEEPVQQKKNNTGLPDNLKSGVESMSGYSMDDVKVHYNSAKPAELQAHAYAQGSDIHVAPGQEKHLAHEAWHVVQQKQGRVQPTKQLKGKTNINDDTGLEKEADVMGAKAMQLNENQSDTSLQRKSTTSYTAQLATVIKYGGLTDFRFAKGAVDKTGEVGTRMEAHLDPRDPKTGTDTSGSNAFNDLFSALQKNTNTTWVRGHLLNHDLGGIAHYNNLFPITTAANGEHYHEVEKLVKHWVGKKCEVDYKVNATKIGGPATPEGKFECEAKVTNDPTEAKTYENQEINKTIYSKVSKTTSKREYEKKDPENVKKFSSVVYNDSNNTYRDTYKGTSVKDSRWNHRSGNSELNNRRVPNAFSLLAPVILPPTPATKKQLNDVKVDSNKDNEISNLDEYEFKDYAEALLNGDIPESYSKFMRALKDEYGEDNELLFKYCLETAKDFDDFMFLYDDIMITIEPDSEEDDGVDYESID